MLLPQPGDLLVRGTAPDRFELVDAVSFEFVDGPFVNLQTALEAAIAREAPAIWQQNFDDHGRPLYDPFQWTVR